jgi:hypothetical protein
MNLSRIRFGLRSALLVVAVSAAFCSVLRWYFDRPFKWKGDHSSFEVPVVKDTLPPGDKDLNAHSRRLPSWLVLSLMVASLLAVLNVGYYWLRKYEIESAAKRFDRTKGLLSEQIPLWWPASWEHQYFDRIQEQSQDSAADAT